MIFGKMVTREVPLADKGQAADSIWEVSQCLRPRWPRPAETSVYPSFACLFAGVLPSLLNAMPGCESTLPDVNSNSFPGGHKPVQTPCHFPVKSTRNPDFTGDGYTLTDDSAFVTGISI